MAAVVTRFCSCRGVRWRGHRGGNILRRTTAAEIYDPSKPVGQRWSTVADSMIWRMYHSEAFLTCNAEVFVSGSETTAEHPVQIYTPDYLHTSKARPVITAVQATLGYSQTFTIGFANVSSLDHIVLNRYSGSTHATMPIRGRLCWSAQLQETMQPVLPRPTTTLPLQVSTCCLS